MFSFNGQLEQVKHFLYNKSEYRLESSKRYSWLATLYL